MQEKPRSHALGTCQVTGLSRELLWDIHSGTEGETWLLARPGGLHFPAQHPKRRKWDRRWESGREGAEESGEKIKLCLSAPKAVDA